MEDKHTITGSKAVHLNFTYLMNFSMTFTFENVCEKYLSTSKEKFPTFSKKPFVRKDSGFDQCPRPSKRRILSTPTEKEFSGKENCRYQSPEIGSDSPSSPMSPLSSSSSDDNDISYICHPCSLTFVHLSQLEAHEAMMHSHLLESDNKKRKTISSFKNECTRCGKRFRDAYGLRRHFNSHINQRSIICNYCNKRFIELNDLNIHLRIHTGEKPFECTICQQKYRQKAHLLSHYRTHTGEKPYSCQQCGKSFTASSGLIKHQRSHDTGNEKESHIVEVIDSIFGS